MSGPRRVEIQRRLPAPIGEVFRWWTVADRLEEWMSPVGNVEAHVDLRVGGAFRITMKLPDAAAESHQGGWGKMLDRLAGRMRGAGTAVATEKD